MGADTPIVWVGPDNNPISDTDTDNYVIGPGEFDSGAKTSTLIIKVAKLDTLTTGSVFKCQIKSTQYSTYSPEVINDMTLTFLTLGMS